MATHPAVIAPGLKQPLIIANVPTPAIQQGEIRVLVEWVPSAPLDVYQVDAGLMAQFPQSLGDTAAGSVVEVGPEVKHFAVGDQVFGFFFHNEKEKAQQIYVTAPEHLFAKIPTGVSPAGAATLPNNFCTAFYSLSDRLGIQLPWPRPDHPTPNYDANIPILIWGGSTSVGQYAIQILKHWGYNNVIATASPKHHDKIKSYGAQHVFDHRDPAIVDAISAVIHANSSTNIGIRVFDCVDSKSGSLAPLAKIAIQPGSIVAALLPVVVSGPGTTETDLQIAADPSKEADWAPDVQVRAVVTYGYEANTFLRDHLQLDIMHTLLANGVVEPNTQRVIQGNTLLERAQRGLDTMRSGTVSGERLVWKVWTAEEFPEFGFASPK